MSALTDALLEAQKELPTAIGRDSQGYGYRYTSLDKLIGETRPILNAHGLTIHQLPATMDSSEGTRPVLITEICYGDEPKVSFTTPLYVADKTMQGFGAAITYARRYAWASVLGIASEEDTDAATLPADGDDVPF